MDATAADVAVTVEDSVTIHVCGSSSFSASADVATMVSSVTAADVAAMTAVEEMAAVVTIHASGSSSFSSAAVAAAANFVKLQLHHNCISIFEEMHRHRSGAFFVYLFKKYTDFFISSFCIAIFGVIFPGSVYHRKLHFIFNHISIFLLPALRIYLINRIAFNNVILIQLPYLFPQILSILLYVHCSMNVIYRI